MKWPLIGVVVTFAITRGVMLVHPTEHRSVVDEMGQVGLTYRLASERGESFYELYAGLVRTRQEAARSSGGPPQDTTRQVVEYPPLAVALMVAPAYFCDLHAADPLRQYATAYHLMLCAADVLTFFTLTWVLTIARPTEQAAARLLVYVVGGTVLYHLIYDRFDLVVGMLTLLAIAATFTRAHWSAPLLVLALAVNLKLVPVILAPVFLLRAGSMKDALMRGTVFVALCAAIFAPFYLTGGKATLDFLKYHADRGLHVESVPATPLLLTSRSELALRHGAVEISTDPARGMVIISTLASLAAVVIVTLATWRLTRRKAIDPAHLALLATLMLWAAMATAKVFSPQYLLWLLPLVPLLDLRQWQFVWFASAFLVICCLTTIIFPYRYWTDIVRPVVDPPRYELLGPTAFGMTLLVMRNGLFVLLLATLASIARREGEAPVEPYAAGKRGSAEALPSRTAHED